MVKILSEIAAVIYTIPPKDFNNELEGKKNYRPAANQKYRVKENVPFFCKPESMDVLVKQQADRGDT